jgi:DNA-binding MarR family transcriptional regulator
MQQKYRMMCEKLQNQHLWRKNMVGRFEQFCTAISSIYRAIQKIERVEMAKYGLKGPHAQCMLAMDRHPEGITAARLCEICEKDKAAISRTLSEMVQEGLVSREG